LISTDCCTLSSLIETCRRRASAEEGREKADERETHLVEFFALQERRLRMERVDLDRVGLVLLLGLYVMRESAASPDDRAREEERDDAP